MSEDEEPLKPQKRQRLLREEDEGGQETATRQGMLATALYKYKSLPHPCYFHRFWHV